MSTPLSSEPTAHPPEEILVSQEGPILWVMFNRPHAHNAMTHDMECQLIDLCKNVALTPSVKAVIFTGAPAARPAFMAGADFASLEQAKTVDDFVALERSSEDLLEAMEAMKVPTIAAIAGACVGGGSLLAACCDVRIATPSLKFGFPIARTVGNCLSVQNYARLVAMVGYALTKEMVYSAKLVGADTLAAAFAIREVVPEAALHERAREIALHLTTLAPLTLWATKTALHRLRDQTSRVIEDDDLLMACYGSNDFKEGVNAFMQKRKPLWQGA